VLSLIAIRPVTAPLDAPLDLPRLLGRQLRLALARPLRKGGIDCRNRLFAVAFYRSTGLASSPELP
jgi:hypothetical protein